MKKYLNIVAIASLLSGFNATQTQPHPIEYAAGNMISLAKNASLSMVFATLAYKKAKTRPTEPTKLELLSGFAATVLLARTLSGWLN